MLDTILFDLDSTLLPFEQQGFIQAYLARLTAALCPLGYQRDALIAAVWSGTKAMAKNDGSRTNREVFWQAFGELSGSDIAATERASDSFYLNEFDSLRSTLHHACDHWPLLTMLKEKNYTVALATNPLFPAAAMATRLAWVGLAPDDFALITSYENSRYCKPNPEYFRAIFSALGKQPAHCLMVGNNVREDMAAAALGAEVFLVTDFLENPEGEDIGRFRHGSFMEFLAFAEQLPAI